MQHSTSSIHLVHPSYYCLLPSLNDRPRKPPPYFSVLPRFRCFCNKNLWNHVVNEISFYYILLYIDKIKARKHKAFAQIPYNAYHSIFMWYKKPYKWLILFWTLTLKLSNILVMTNDIRKSFPNINVNNIVFCSFLLPFFVRSDDDASNGK